MENDGFCLISDGPSDGQPTSDTDKCTQALPFLTKTEDEHDVTDVQLGKKPSLGF